MSSVPTIRLIKVDFAPRPTAQAARRARRLQLPDDVVDPPSPVTALVTITEVPSETASSSARIPSRSSAMSALAGGPPGVAAALATRWFR